MMSQGRPLWKDPTWYLSCKGCLSKGFFFWAIMSLERPFGKTLFMRYFPVTSLMVSTAFLECKTALLGSCLSINYNFALDSSFTAHHCHEIPECAIWVWVNKENDTNYQKCFPKSSSSGESISKEGWMSGDNCCMTGKNICFLDIWMVLLMYI